MPFSDGFPWGPTLLVVALFVYIGLRRQGIGLSEIPNAIFDGIRQAWKKIVGD